MAYPGRPGPSPVLAALVAGGTILPSDRVLDLGCGTGTDAVALARLGARAVVGVDVDRRALGAARRRARGLANVEFVEADARRLDAAFPRASFDGAVDTLLLNNLRGEDVDAYARGVARVVRPGGWLALAERVTAAAWKHEPERASPPAPLPRWFSFGPTVASHLPEHPDAPGGPAWARVAVSVGWRNRRKA